jgi:hypothetical protein
MYRVPLRLARAVLPALSATFLLSGCMALGGSGPAALGAGTHRSIKDDPEPPAVATPAPKQAPAKMAVVLPPPRPQPQPPRAATPKRAEAPSCASGSDCMVRLKAMIDDPSRGWIGKPQSPAEYANGTRLFAYRALHSQLTCPQLTTALNEVATAANTYRAPVQGVSAAQAKRVLALNTEVERELRSEFARRCKG